MMLYVAAFLTSLIFVGLKSFQQLNVFHDRYLLVVPTSMAMACAEVWIIHKASLTGPGWIVIPIGLGGGIGALISMSIHRHFQRRKES